jgi:Ca-activated chloride channel homolog
LPESQPQHDVLATLWARARIDDLMSQDFGGLQRGGMTGEVREAITQLGLEYRLLTQFTSFVAVEEMIVTEGGQPRRIDVPVEMPEGVSYGGVFGEQRGSGRVDRARYTETAQEFATVTRGKSPAPKDLADRARVRMLEVRPVPAPTPVLSSPDDLKRQQLLSKLHPSIAAVTERLKNKQARPGAEEAEFIRDGKAEIQIWLANKSAEAIAELKRLGFEVILDPQSSKSIIGRLPVEKLAALAELSSVKYVAPQTK